MAQINAPGVAQTKLRGTLGVNPWAVLLHWYNGTGSPWSQSQINALATAVNARFTSGMMALFANNVRFIQVEAIDLSDTTLRISQTPVANTPGTTPNPSPTLAACILVSHRIPDRFRGGHPRTYLPPSGTANTGDGDNWAQGFISTAQTSWDTFKNGVVTDIGAAGITTGTLTVPRYTYSYTADANKHKFIKERVAFIGARSVTASVVSTKIATQRRRMGT